MQRSRKTETEEQATWEISMRKRGCKFAQRSIDTLQIYLNFKIKCKIAICRANNIEITLFLVISNILNIEHTNVVFLYLILYM